MSTSQLLEANLDRVLDGVLRTLRSAASDAGIAGAGSEIPQSDSAPRDDTSAELLATLCGRVAEALRGMEVTPGHSSDYRATSAAPDQHGKLDVRR